MNGNSDVDGILKIPGDNKGTQNLSELLSEAHDYFRMSEGTRIPEFESFSGQF